MYNASHMSNYSQIKISVLIPIYNAEQYLEQALESLSCQNIPQCEFLCINDGSTDRSRAIIQDFAKQDKRFKLVDKQNSGYGSSMNLGIRMAQGSYIAILEPDDYIEGQMYSKLYQLAENVNFPDVVKSAYWIIREPFDSTESFRCGYWKRIKHRGVPFAIKDEPLLTRYHPSIWSAIYRKEFLQENDICFKEVPGAGWVDNPFMIETLLKAHSIVYTDNAYYCYRDSHNGSSTANIADMKMPIDRWLEMTEIMNQNISSTTEELWSIQAYKAFHYLEYAKRAKNYDSNKWLEFAREVMINLDPVVVAESKYLSHKQKVFYEQLSDRKLSSWSDLPYKKMLLEEVFWKIRQNGVSFMVKRAKEF